MCKVKKQGFLNESRQIFVSSYKFLKKQRKSKDLFTYTNFKIMITSSLIKQDVGSPLTFNCWTKADLLIIVRSEPLSRTSIITY